MEMVCINGSDEKVKLYNSVRILLLRKFSRCILTYKLVIESEGSNYAG